MTIKAFLTQKNRAYDQGFTITETLVTLVVTTIFFMVFIQLMLVIIAQRSYVANEAAANDIAYSNLMKVTSKTKLNGVTCTTAGWDLTQYGFDVVPNTDEQLQSLGAGVTQKLWAYPSNGCGPHFASEPMRIVSTVTYKVKSTGVESAVTHASYVR